MTKIKNTKKGMAKKTLSMSLVVAMLATSNVPVWASEFSDGTDISTFSSEAEAPVVDNEVTDDTASAQTIVDDSSAATTPSVSIVADENTAAVGQTLSVSANRSNEGLDMNASITNQEFVAFGWFLVDATGKELERLDSKNQDGDNKPVLQETYTVVEKTAGNRKTAGNYIVCRMFAHYTDDSWKTLAESKPIPVAYSLNAKDYYKSTIKTEGYVTKGDQLSYTGKVTAKNGATVSEPKWYDPNGKEVGPGSEGFLRATENGE